MNVEIRLYSYLYAYVCFIQNVRKHRHLSIGDIRLCFHRILQNFFLSFSRLYVREFSECVPRAIASMI